MGGHGSIGSGSSSSMGVTLGYPSGHPDPHSSVIASAVESQSTAGSAAIDAPTTTTGTDDTPTGLIARQPPIGIETAAATNPTYVSRAFHFFAFYRAMLCIRGTSQGPVYVSVCVCLSVTSRCSTKTAKRRITQTTPHYSPGTLVFGCQRSPRNSTGVYPCGGAKCRWGGSKSATFDK